MKREDLATERKKRVFYGSYWGYRDFIDTIDTGTRKRTASVYRSTTYGGDDEL